MIANSLFENPPSNDFLPPFDSIQCGRVYFLFRAPRRLNVLCTDLGCGKSSASEPKPKYGLFDQGEQIAWPDGEWDKRAVGAGWRTRVAAWLEIA